MLSYIWKQYGFEILFGLAVVVFVVVFVYNLFTKKKGSYDDHIGLMKNLWNKSYDVSKKDRKPFQSKGETECRRVMEKMTGKPFPRTRPNFLKNEITGGNNLELDCYNEELGLAVEYNGEQHYKYTPYFHPNKDAFYNTKYRDDMKSRLCKENGVKLVVVPYTVPLASIEKYLLENARIFSRS